MAVFNRGEVIRCVLDIKTISLYGAVGSNVNPSSVPVITITDPNGTVLVNEASMTAFSTGLYYYNHASLVTHEYGKYQIKYKVTDGSLITIHYDSFELGQ